MRLGVYFRLQDTPIYIVRSESIFDSSGKQGRKTHVYGTSRGHQEKAFNISHRVVIVLR